MAFRLLISDAVWAEVEPVLRDLKHAAGRPPALSDRLFIEAVLYQARTGTPWRDLPEAFGDWNAVSHRFRRWEQRTLWQRLGERIHRSQNDCLQDLFIASTMVRLISTPPAPPKKRRATSPGSGSLSGGLSTKLHAACPDARPGVSFVLSGGERPDAGGFEPVWQGLPAAVSGLGVAVRDKASDSPALRHVRGALGIEAVILPRPAPECSYRGSNRTETLASDQEQDKVREQVERCFNKLKPFCRMATRYEKLSRTFLALIHIVSTGMMLRPFLSKKRY